MDASVNSLNWFEIPAKDIARAKTFYENIFGITMETMDMMGMKMAFFPAEPSSGKASGGLCESPYHTPSQDGAIIYLNANPDLSAVTGKIEAAGGQVAMPKTKISDEIGYMAFFIDSEGNRVGLHSQQ
ncbi:MAG TPA: VOC family protein [Chitinophagaceae bacterium]|nr:VOC family protein [Chitinophagaceae bacterium]